MPDASTWLFGRESILPEKKPRRTSVRGVGAVGKKVEVGTIETPQTHLIDDGGNSCNFSSSFSALNSAREAPRPTPPFPRKKPRRFVSPSSSLSVSLSVFLLKIFFS